MSGCNKSPINLARSSAKDCELKCELEVDDVSVEKVTCYVDTDGLLVIYNKSEVTCKYNGDGYTVLYSLLTNPAQHMVEDVRAQAEFTTFFSNPTGKQIAVSILIRSAPGSSPSTEFFNSFIPYVTQKNVFVTVSSGKNFLLPNIIPSNPSYFVYEGADSKCKPTTFIVFQHTVNMDTNDFASLNRIVSAKSVPIVPIGNRTVFYSDAEALKGSDEHSKRDGKVYMRCKRLGPKPPPALKSDLVTVGNEKQSAESRDKIWKDLYDKKYPGVGNDKLSLSDILGITFGVLTLLIILIWQKDNILELGITFANMISQASAGFVESIIRFFNTIIGYFSRSGKNLNAIPPVKNNMNMGVASRNLPT